MVANIVKQEWFAHYPWPTQVTFDRGSKFIGQDFQNLIKNDYGVKPKPISVRNPQANAIVERVRQVMAMLYKPSNFKIITSMKKFPGREI